MDRATAWKLMYDVIDQSPLQELLDPDAQDLIQSVVTTICERFEADFHSEFLRHYEQGCEDEKNNLKHDIEHYKYELGIATGAIERNFSNGETRFGESNTSKRAKKSAAQYVARNIG